MSTTAPTEHRKWLPVQVRPWDLLLVAGTAFGAAAFGYQWVNGLGVTGMSNTVSWGLYIILFMFLVGVSAGGLIVVAASELVGTDRFEPLNRLAVIVSGTAIAAAALSILPDIGRPEMFWKMIVQPNWTSPLVWDMVVISLYLSIAVADLWILTRHGSASKAMHRMALLALPAAVLVHSVTAWIFGLLVARPWWNSALMAPLFISSALVSGTALVLVVAHVAERTTRFELPGGVFSALGRLMVWFIGVDAFLLGAELLTTYTSRVEDHVMQLEVILTGRLAPVFWAEVLLGVAIPFVIFAVPRLRSSRVWLVTGATLALLGVFAKRVNILLPGMYEPLVGLEPGIPGGRAGQAFVLSPSYVPTWVEVGVVVGVLAFAAGLITLGIRRYVATERP